MTSSDLSRLPHTNLTTRQTCRVCGCPDLAPTLDLGAQCIAGAFADPHGEKPVERAIPLELVRCDTTRNENACGLIQLRHSVPGSILYRSYWYRSGVNRTMTVNLHEIAQQARQLAHPTTGDLIVDVGCNDGTLFDGYGEGHFNFFGVDPSDVTRYAVEKGYRVANTFFSREVLRRVYPDTKAKIITSIAMFYDLEHPDAFVADIADSLAERGVWVLEMAYLPLMLENTTFDTICHEHLEYYSLAVLERLFAGAGLETLKAEENAINGGSIRIFVGHAGKHEIHPSDREGLQRLRLREFEMALESPEPYEAFRQRTEAIRDKLRAVVQERHAAGKTIHVYGASTKGNTILQYCGIDRSLVGFAADRNPDKWGSETIHTGIPIVSEEESRAMNPDCYLVLPWHFLDEFVEREADFLRGGGEFIVPLPEVRIVGAEALGEANRAEPSLADLGVDAHAAQ